jgi:predicted ester cyclase
MDQATKRVEANRALGSRFFAEQDRLRGGPAPELCAPSYKAVLGGNPPLDRAGHEAFAKVFYAAFPDLRHEIELVVADPETAVVRFVLHGTHRGAFFSIPPTQKPIKVAAHVILRVRGGVVEELYGIFDEAGMLRQLGVLQG